MKRVLGVLFALVVSASLLLLTRPAYASSGCSDETVKGTYGFTFTGFNRITQTRNVPFDGVGIGTFDGMGNFSATFASSFNGEISTDNTYIATYSVSSNCTGVLNGLEGNDNFSLVVLHNGAEIFALDTTTGETITIDLKRQ